MPDHDDRTLEGLWAHHHATLRDPHQIVSQWREASDIDPALLESQVRGAWWEALDRAGITLLVTREYEHLVMAFCVRGGRPRVSYLHLPHPNGMAVDGARMRVHIASTRNPNLIFEFGPCAGEATVGDSLRESPANRGAIGPPWPADDQTAGMLLPVGARYLPGRLYTHDLALIGGRLHANAVGLNAVVRLPQAGGFDPVWWPRCIDGPRGPRMDKNYLQLNSIAAGPSLKTSYFAASAAAPSRRRPGHLNFPVDRRGVIFSGATREPVAAGLTRPHSARLRGKELWVDNSGYGEVGRIVGGRFEPVARPGGWTRGLFFHGGLAFVGTSRVIPKYRRYAPGLDPDRCETGVHAIDLGTGKVLGSVLWPNGNQIFAVEGLDREITPGFPFTHPAGRGRKRVMALFARGAAA